VATANAAPHFDVGRNKMIKLLTSLLLLSSIVAANASDEYDLLSDAETYKHSCEVVAKVNSEDWEYLKKLPDPWNAKGILKGHFENGRPEGIGAYRETTKDGNLGDLTHHFAFGGRKTPHELLIAYEKKNDYYVIKGIWIQVW